jgi:UPF0042 nucleotide-binding protein
VKDLVNLQELKKESDKLKRVDTLFFLHRERRCLMDRKELIIITGLSGAGITTASRYFDKAGYFTIDNLPIDNLIEVVKTLNESSRYIKYAISLNTLMLDDNKVAEVIKILRTFDWINIRIIYLDILDSALIKRYQLTRSKHPLTIYNESLDSCISEERLKLKELKLIASTVIDTTNLKEKDLGHKLSRIFDREILPKFTVDFVSFGYKNGVPIDLDYTFDVRFIPNPYYIDELKDLTGNDKPVYDYVFKQKETTEFLEHLIPFLDFCFKKQKQTGRSYLVIGIGCTGGQHRSVAITNYLKNYYKDQYTILSEHRHAKK